MDLVQKIQIKIASGNNSLETQLEILKLLRELQSQVERAIQKTESHIGLWAEVYKAV